MNTKGCRPEVCGALWLMRSSHWVLFFCSGFLAPAGELAPSAASDSVLFTFKESDPDGWMGDVICYFVPCSCTVYSYMFDGAADGNIPWHNLSYVWTKTCQFITTNNLFHIVNINILMRALTNLSSENNRRKKLLMSIYFGGFKDVNKCERQQIVH